MKTNSYRVYCRNRVRAEARTKRSRRLVGQRDNGRCFACKFFTGAFINVTHHIKPVAKGGEPWAENLVTLCPNCHALVHRLTKFWWCTVYQRRDSILHFQGIDFGRAFKLALLSTEEVFIYDDRTIWPRTKMLSEETLKRPELHELLYAENYDDSGD